MNTAKKALTKVQEILESQLAQGRVLFYQDIDEIQSLVAEVKAGIADLDESPPVTTLSREDIDTHFEVEGAGELFDDDEIIDLAEKIGAEIVEYGGNFYDLMERFIKEDYPILYAEIQLMEPVE